MRFLVVLAVLASLALGPDARAEVEIVRVFPGYRTAESFQRISEFFSGREHRGRQITLRTQPEFREGYYFLVRTRNRESADLAGARLALQLILPDSPDPVTYDFPVDVPTGSRVILAGLTGRDWAGAGIHPVAWHLALIDAQDRVLASEQSFLWAHPQ